jgi:alpha-1,3-fucosyltransferase 10
LVLANKGVVGPPHNQNVTVAMLSPHSFGKGFDYEPNCTSQVNGKHYTCRWVYAKTEQEAVNMHAAAALYHAPYGCVRPGTESSPRLPRVVWGMEPAAIHKCLDDPNYMAMFDIEMTYRRCSQVHMPFFTTDTWFALLQEPIPFDKKANAVAYINSNCHTPSGRADIVRALLKMKHSSVKIKSFGKCDTNSQHVSNNKIEVFKTHKFCIAMENSLSPDYVTEKIWDALIAGCIPIYLGAPNIKEFVPDPNAVIFYGEGNITTPAALMAEMERLAGDESLYNQKLSWKQKRLHELSLGFQHLVNGTFPVSQLKCQICKFLLSNKETHFQNCLQNTTWMKKFGRVY